MVLPSGHNFGVGSEIAITCNVGGYPSPSVTWFKDDVELSADSRIQIISKCGIHYFFVVLEMFIHIR